MAQGQDKGQQVPGGWSRLRCDCGGEQFAPLVYLRWRDGGGVTTEPAGYQCIACQAVQDSAHLISMHQLREKRRAVRQQEEELAAMEGTKSPPSGGG